MISHEDLLNDDYIKSGNWYRKDNIAINLIGAKIKYTTTGLFLNFDNKNISISEVNNFRDSIRVIIDKSTKINY